MTVPVYPDTNACQAIRFLFGSPIQSSLTSPLEDFATCISRSSQSPLETLNRGSLIASSVAYLVSPAACRSLASSSSGACILYWVLSFKGSGTMSIVTPPPQNKTIGPSSDPRLSALIERTVTQYHQRSRHAPASPYL